MPPVVAIIGKKNCGKTTLIEKLIPELIDLGYRIGTIKHHHGDISIDQPGKDTWRHKQAGAHAVVLVNTREIDVATVNLTISIVDIATGAVITADEKVYYLNYPHVLETKVKKQLDAFMATSRP